MPGKFKIAHIGAGFWGKNIIRNLNDLKELKFICDIDKQNLQDYQKLYPNLTYSANFKEILADKTIDAVTIATPAATHFSLVKEALSAGKDVFVEKPLALSQQEGERLAEIATQNDRILMVGHILRYHPAMKRIKQLVDSGKLGKIGYCYSNRLNFGKVRREENILWSFAPHDISVILYLMDGPPDEVKASGEIILQPRIHDVTHTVMKWEAGVTAYIYVSWLHPFKEHRFVVVGDKAMAMFDDTRRSEKLVLYDKGFDIVKGQLVKREQEGEIIEFDQTEPLRLELEHFLSCIQNRTQPDTDAKESIAVLRVLSLAQVALDGRQESEALTAKTNYFAHRTAVVDSGAQIGRDTRIWHFSHVMPGAKIGERCSLGHNVFVANNVRIGNNVKIQNNVSVYEGVILEDDCFCGPSMVFTNVKNPRSAFPRNTADDYVKTYVKRGATLGANCTIICGVIIGEYAFVAAGAVVNQNVKPNALVAGVPAKQFGWMCECGFRLKKLMGGLACPECNNKYILKAGNRIVLK